MDVKDLKKIREKQQRIEQEIIKNFAFKCIVFFDNKNNINNPVTLEKIRTEASELKEIFKNNAQLKKFFKGKGMRK